MRTQLGNSYIELLTSAFIVGCLATGFVYFQWTINQDARASYNTQVALRLLENAKAVLPQQLAIDKVMQQAQQLLPQGQLQVIDLNKKIVRISWYDVQRQQIVKLQQ